MVDIELFKKALRKIAKPLCENKIDYDDAIKIVAKTMKISKKQVTIYPCELSNCIIVGVNTRRKRKKEGLTDVVEAAIDCEDRTFYVYVFTSKEKF